MAPPRLVVLQIDAARRVDTGERRGALLEELVPAPDRAEVDARLSSVQRDRRPARLALSDGRVLDLAPTAGDAVLAALSSTPGGGAGSEQVDQLSELAARYELIHQSVSELISLVRVDGDELRLVSANPPYCALYGRRRDELEGRALEEIVGGDRLAQLRGLYREAIQRGGTLQHRQWVPHAGDGRPRILQSAVTPVLDAQGRCTHVLNVDRDVTEQVRRDEDRRRSEVAMLDQQRALVELSVLGELDTRAWLSAALPLAARTLSVQRVGFWRFTSDRAWLRCELRFSRPGGHFDEGELLRDGEPASTLARSETAARTAAANAGELPEDGGAASLMDIAVWSDGALVGMLRFEHGGIRQWTMDEQRFGTSLAHLLSIRIAETQRHAAEQNLRVAERLASLGTLAAGVAHEINNPLGFIMGNLEFVRGELAENPATAGNADLHDAVADALTGARRVRDIVMDLKALSRDSDDPSEHVVDLQRVISLSARMAQSALRHRAQLRVLVPEGLCVRGTESRLGQVFLNLLVNAAQAMPERPASQNVVTIRGGLEEGQVTISVQDNGTGITEEVRRRMFDPFFTTKPVGVGTGLGLSIVHGIVAQAGGTIDVSSAVGVGTTFHLRFPFAGQPLGADDAPSARTASRRRRVLVIDDEPMTGTAIRRVLGEHQVEAVTDGRDALRRLGAGERFDVILCDLMMPHMTGMDVHQHIQERFPDHAPRVVFITGGAMTDEAQRFLERGAVRLLQKPFDAEELRRMVLSTAPDGGAARE